MLCQAFKNTQIHTNTQNTRISCTCINTDQPIQISILSTNTNTQSPMTIQNTDQTYIDKNMPPPDWTTGSVLRWARATIGSFPTRFLRRSSRHNTKRTSPTDLLPNETHDQTDYEQKVTTNAKKFVLGVVHCAFVVFSSFCQWTDLIFGWVLFERNQPKKYWRSKFLR